MSEPIIEGEIWKAIPGFEGRYSASNFGRIKSHKFKGGKQEGILIPYPVGRNGRLKVDLGGRPFRRISKYVSRLVISAFLGTNEFRPEVNHKNGDFTDNRVENLEWCTRSENHLHRFRVLGHVVGNRKLDIRQVRQIRTLFASGASSYSLAKGFRVSRTNIRKIVAYETWRLDY